MKTKYYLYNNTNCCYDKCSKWLFKAMINTFADKIELIPSTDYRDSDNITLDVMYNTKYDTPVCKAEIILY